MVQLRKKSEWGHVDGVDNLPETGSRGATGS